MTIQRASRKFKKGGMKIMHKKIGHLIAHIAYIALYGVLIISTIFLYNSADLAELLYAGLYEEGFKSK